MDAYDEMTKNGMDMQKITKLCNRVSIIYAALCLPYALAHILSCLIFPEGFNILYLILDSVIMKSAIFFCGFMSCYKHKNIFVIYTFLIQLLNLILDNFFKTSILDFNFNYLIFIAVIVMSILTFCANKKYEYLENQFGFPHFNERRTNQEFDKKQREIKDEFQQNYERIIKTSSDEMTDMDLNSRDTFPNRKNLSETDNEKTNISEEMDTI